MIQLSEQTKSRIALIILSLFILVLLINYYGFQVPRNVKVQVNHVVVCGQIIKYEHSSKGSTMTCKFAYKGKNFIVKGSGPTNTAIKKYYTVGGNIFVVFEKGNPENCRLLPEWDDFTYYNIQPSDTAEIECGFY